MPTSRWFGALFPGDPSTADQFEAARERMVRGQIKARGVRSPGVLEAMRKTPRHLFIPPPMQPVTYEDRPVAIGYGQTISQPYIVALMTELLDVRDSDRVLEIGTGSGYQTAILSGLAKEVYTIEIVPELAREAAGVLTRLNYPNVIPREGDGYEGWPEKAPFERIILTAATPEIPQALIDQLAVNGKLVAPEGVEKQKIIVIEKLPDGSLSRKQSIPVHFVPMVH
jgi:protein-L-isoaspartate(D-aspartate) O-methyltransferase